MSILGRYFQAERIKWRWGWTLLPTVLAPICQAGFLFTLAWYSEAQMRHFQPGFRFWVELNFLAWNLVVMPVTVALISELSWSLEEESRTWDHLLFQPVPRRVHFVVKLMSHLSLAMISFLLLLVLLVPAGLALRGNPNLEMGVIPWREFCGLASWSALAILPLVCLHTWLGVRLPGVGIALVVALVGTLVCCQLVGNSGWASWLPWGLAAQFLSVLDRTRSIAPVQGLAALACALMIAALGLADFGRRVDRAA